MLRVLASLGLSLVIIPNALAVSESWFQDGAASVEIAGTVDVPLYRGAATDALPAVLVTGPANDEGVVEAQALANVDLLSDWTRVSSGFAKALGVKVKSSKLHGKSVKTAVIPELHVGDVVLTDVRAQVDGDASMTLGLATLDELGAAVLPSEGVVRLVPAAEAGALVQSLGAPLPLTRQEGKWFEAGHKMYANGLDMAVPGEAFGQEGLVRIQTAETTTTYAAHVAPEGERAVGADLYAWGSLAVAGLQLDDTWLLRDESILTVDRSVIGALGYDLLYRVDVAYDPAAGSLGLAIAEQVQWTDPAELLVEIARADYERAMAEDDEGDADEDDDGDADEAESTDEAEAADGPDKGEPDVVTAETALAAALWSTDAAEALTHYEAAAEAAGDNCQPYLELGQALVRADRAADAIPHLQRAGELYERWWSQDREDREKLSKGKKIDGAWTLKQPGSCHVAWGQLAAAHAAAGDADAVAGLADEKVDLDPTLPRVYGLHLIAAGELDASNGPIRRAMNLRIMAEPADHVALAAAHTSEDQHLVFDRQVERVVAPGMGDLGLYMSLTELARRDGGSERVAEVLDQMDALHPHSPEVALLRGVEAIKLGDEAALKQALLTAKPLLDAKCLREAHSADARAYRIVFNTLSGDTEGSGRIIDMPGTKSSIERGAKVVWLRAMGDDEKADRCLASMARRGPAYPMDALGLVPDLGYIGPKAVFTDGHIELMENVLFVPGESTLLEDSTDLLEDVLAILGEHDELTLIEIAGHTDNTGTPEDNQTLSEARAAAVLQWLLDHGVAEERLRSAGYGDTEPIADNESPEGRAQNRRVEFRIIEQ